RTRGVSALLQGDKSQLVPEGNERMARRRKLDVLDPGYEVGCGGGAAEGPPGILPLPVMSGHGTGHAASNG
ncbi:MAG TPA: hypothetical protein VH092_21805, partial [Urbifossiella sp.]|nr:hypothetical protein [Urbifossiella sp.]